MSIIMQINPFDFFVDRDGDALDAGYIWIGEVNKDPRQYPVVAYYDEALTIPAAMPLRTSNGYIVRNGTPSFLYINGNYSVRVEDSNRRQVYYVPDFLLIGSDSAVSASELANDTNMNLGISLVGGGARVVPTMAALKALIPPTPVPGRTYATNTLGYVSPSDGGHSNYLWDASSIAVGDDFSVVVPDTAPVAGRWLIVNTPFMRPEQAGAIGDYVFSPFSGTINTVALQKLLNYCSIDGTEIKLSAGKKYLTDTLYLYFDSVKNPGWAGRPGRTKITGQADGHATGDIESPGCAIAHINGAARALIECVGVFSVANPTAMGGYLSLEDINLIGGTATTHVLRLQGSQGSMFFKNYTVKVVNPAGNGITEATTWETIHQNGLIRGGAIGDGAWTGTLLDITTDGTAGQTNMKIYNNVNCYKGGNAIRIGRRGFAQGTFGPLVFIGGQTSLSDQNGLWLDGGVISFSSIGQQFEGARLNGIKIDREYSPGNLATDLARNVKFSQSYITGCGTIEDGSLNSFAIHVANGDGIYFEGTTFNNVGNGVAVNQAEVTNFKLLRPTFRTVRTYGATSGTGVNFYGTAQTIQKFQMEDPIFNQNPSVQVNSAAVESFSRYEAGGFASSVGPSTPNISFGGEYASASFHNLNLNNPVDTDILDITGGRARQVLRISFSNLKSTIKSNANIRLAGGADFTPSSIYSTITLRRTDNEWVEESRSQNA